MSLDFELTHKRSGFYYNRNITHNLGDMAEEAGIYEVLWHPDRIGITKAKQCIEPLTKGLIYLSKNKEHCEKFNSSNGWGLYENFVPFVADVLEACRACPNATVKTDT